MYSCVRHSLTAGSVFVIETVDARLVADVQASPASPSLCVSVATHIKRGSLALFSLCHQLLTGAVL